jgi:putative ABC transport system substrate-binding protein
VALKVDLILTSGGTPAALAAKQATTTIPIVMGGGGDAVGSGLVASLAQPGGNVTGLSDSVPELYVKRLELLKEAVPRVERIAVLISPTTQTPRALKPVESAARALKIKLYRVEVQRADELERALFHDRPRTRRRGADRPGSPAQTST